MLELFLPGLQQYDNYKYAVHSSGKVSWPRPTPNAFHGETRPGTASTISVRLPTGRRELAGLPEEQPGLPEATASMRYIWSWRHRRRPNVLPGHRTILAPREGDGLRHCGSCSPSRSIPWTPPGGYQCTGYFAATSRFGTRLHVAGGSAPPGRHRRHPGLGARRGLPKDAFGLYEFDGKPRHEYADPRKGEHADWALPRGQARCGPSSLLRPVLAGAVPHRRPSGGDAVASTLTWTTAGQGTNVFGGHENLEAVVSPAAQYPHLAPTATDRLGTTAGPRFPIGWTRGDWSLGFNLKWNMGWMNAFSTTLKLPAPATTTFATYAFSENFVLPRPR